MSLKLARPIVLCAVLIIPALFVRLSGVHLQAVPGLLVFGAAVVAASFLLAWAVEADRPGAGPGFRVPGRAGLPARGRACGVRGAAVGPDQPRPRPCADRPV